MCLRFGFLLSFLLLFSACAVVEPLSGGEDDEYAPVPQTEKMSPKNGSTNFSGNEIRIPFDEYFRLNNPSENLVVIPPDIKPKAKIKNKTLVISWEGQLQSNTTYAFYLNELVQDVNEKNDSLMSFVFSTGANIDSLMATFQVFNAFEQTILADQTVGLYSSFSDSTLPNYFGKTDKNGKVSLLYMKPGEYQLAAFNDKNKNLKHDKNESFGFLSEQLALTNSQPDSTVVFVSPVAQVPRIRTLKLNAPGTMLVGATVSLEGAEFSLNGEKLPSDYLLSFGSDSVLMPFNFSDSSNFELIVNAPKWTDTSSFRLLAKEKESKLNLTLLKTDAFFEDEVIRLFANQEIVSLNVPSILLKNPTDGSLINLRRIKSTGAILELDFLRKDEIKTLELIFLPSSVVGQTGANTDTLKYKITVLTAREVGALQVILSGFDGGHVLDLMKKGTLVQRVTLSKGLNKHTFKNLLPGDYTFRLTLDDNENGRWDGSDWDEKKQAEKVKLFLKPNRVRGNWDTEITLENDGN